MVGGWICLWLMVTSFFMGLGIGVFISVAMHGRSNRRGNNETEEPT